ncbi:MAG: hypothetical protein D6736_20690 [Nitrospinota bacterium]|nr:MAG: hypothetical protein D6736_20690 [Nitrospinota bacterium]
MFLGFLLAALPLLLPLLSEFFTIFPSPAGKKGGRDLPMMGRSSVYKSGYRQGLQGKEERKFPFYRQVGVIFALK